MIYNIHILLISLLMIAAAGIAVTAQAQESEKSGGQLVHNVYFWFHEDVSEEEHQNFYHELKKLSEIPLILDGWIGVPAATEDRGVIDSSYDYSITFVFENEETESEYQTHPDHEEFIDNNSHLWEKVTVYDAKDPNTE